MRYASEKRSEKGGARFLSGSSKKWRALSLQISHCYRDGIILCLFATDSFVLHEADGEADSAGSSNTTLTMPGEEGADDTPARRPSNVKRMSQSNASVTKPHLLRRATGVPAGAGGHGGSGSFKRRSIKLKKPGKTKHRSATVPDDDDDVLRQQVKRADSLRSRRKVSGISEKSDTSEHADISGEESPGVLSDDGQQPDLTSEVFEADDNEMISSMPWLRVLLALGKHLNYTCTHQGFCQNNCYKRQMRSCNRLMKAVEKVFLEDLNADQQQFDTFSLRLLDDKVGAIWLSDSFTAPLKREELNKKKKKQS